MHKRYIVVFLIALFSMPALDVTAQTKKQPKAAVIEPPEDRVRILIEVSDAFSFLDKSRAIASFTRLFQNIDSMDSEGSAESNKFNYLRQAALARIARRDPELAAKVSRNPPPLSPADKWSNELNAMSTPHSETLMGVAQDLSSKGLSLAVQASVCRSSAATLAQEEAQ